MNVKDWREEMAKVRDDLRAGRISVSAANAIIKMSNSAMQGAQLQLNYYKNRRELPDIDFLKGVRHA